MSQHEGGRTLIIGRLGTAPTLTARPGGGRAATFSIAVRTREAGADQHVDVTDEAIAFGQVAEQVAGLEGGQRVCVEGRWQARQDARPILVVDQFSLCGPRVRPGADHPT